MGVGHVIVTKGSERASHCCLVTGLCLAVEKQLSPGTVECGLIIYSV